MIIKPIKKVKRLSDGCTHNGYIWSESEQAYFCYSCGERYQDL